MRRLALSLAAAISLAAGLPALAAHHGGGGGHGGGNAHGGGGAHSSAAPRSAFGGPFQGGGVFGALRFLDRRRPYGPHNADNSGPPHFYGGRFLGYSDGNPYYCSNGHRVHWDRGVSHWVRWGDYIC